MQKTGDPTIADPYEGAKDYSAKVGALSHAVGVTMGVKQYAGDNLIGVVRQRNQPGKSRSVRGACQRIGPLPR